MAKVKRRRRALFDSNSDFIDSLAETSAGARRMPSVTVHGDTSPSPASFSPAQYPYEDIADNKATGVSVHTRGRRMWREEENLPDFSLHGCCEDTCENGGVCPSFFLA